MTLLRTSYEVNALTEEQCLFFLQDLLQDLFKSKFGWVRLAPPCDLRFAQENALNKTTTHLTFCIGNR